LAFLAMAPFFFFVYGRHKLLQEDSVGTGPTPVPEDSRDA
jgi:hypothetical protein